MTFLRQHILEAVSIIKSSWHGPHLQAKRNGNTVLLVDASGQLHFTIKPQPHGLVIDRHGEPILTALRSS